MKRFLCLVSSRHTAPSSQAGAQAAQNGFKYLVREFWETWNWSDHQIEDFIFVYFVYQVLSLIEFYIQNRKEPSEAE